MSADVKATLIVEDEGIQKSYPIEDLIADSKDLASCRSALGMTKPDQVAPLVRSVLAERNALRERLRRGEFERLLMAIGVMALQEHGLYRWLQVAATLNGIPCRLENVVFGEEYGIVDPLVHGCHRTDKRISIVVARDNDFEFTLERPFEGLEFHPKAPQ